MSARNNSTAYPPRKNFNQGATKQMGTGLVLTSLDGVPAEIIEAVTDVITTNVDLVVAILVGVAVLALGRKLWTKLFRLRF